MNSRRETGMAWLMAIGIAALAALILMASCKTSKVITETVWEHDTLTVHHSDTVKEVVYKSRVDTVTNTEVHTYTLNNVGDTVKEIHHDHTYEKVIVVDSTDRYKSIVDSLQSIINHQHDKQQKTVKKQRSWSDYLILLALVGIAVLLVRKIP